MVRERCDDGRVRYAKREGLSVPLPDLNTEKVAMSLGMQVSWKLRKARK